MAAHPDLQDEQRFLDRAYRRLESMRGDASRMLESVLDVGRGGTFQSRTERDIVVRTSLARLAQLDIGDQALCFGRIDRVPDESHPAGELFHIGRLAVAGEDLEPLVVDWRAPVAEPFYRATGLDPQGLSRRRHLAVRGRAVTGIEDEYFSAPGATERGRRRTGGPGSEVATEDGSGGRLLDEGAMLGGPAALLAALGQARTGRMGDIVATIQREQDEIIRAPLGGLLMVQGGPGTGKTAVALHRAAYLLYTHRFPLERQGVLVVGPNPLFLRYIEQVLPSLGETGVTLSTVSGLVPEVRVRGVDEPLAERLKGEARMARVIARAVHTRQRPLRVDLRVPFGTAVLRLSTKETAEVVALARRRPGPHNARRRFVEQRVATLLVDQYLERRGGGRLVPPDGAGGAGQGPDGPDNTAGPDGPDNTAGPDGPDNPDGAQGDDRVDRAELSRRLLRVRELVEALDRMWPRLAPHELLHDLFGAPALLRAAGKGVLTDEELASLHRPRSAALDEVPWTAGDAALVDEARAILGPRRSRPRRGRTDGRARPERGWREPEGWPAGLDPPWASVGVGRDGPDGDDVRAYGHIVVDEVQDLSPMQLRMLARRSLSGSMTVVGDVAQATGPWAPVGWREIRHHLGSQRDPHLVELTVSYRTPAEVLAAAGRVLAVAVPGAVPPRPVRSSGFSPSVVRVAPASLADRAAQAAIEEAAAVAPGRTAVLVPRPLFASVRDALARQGMEAVDPRDPAGQGLSAPVVVLPADQANGLEFDAVVVVEPALVAAPGAGSPAPPLHPPPSPLPGEPTTRGLRALYVALTRPTRRLAVVHAAPLPVDLGPVAEGEPPGPGRVPWPPPTE